MTPRIVAIHGISEKTNAAGFSHLLRDLTLDAYKKHKRAMRGRARIPMPQWVECVYSDLIDLPGQNSIINVIDLIADVVKYTRSENIRRQIRDRFIDVVKPGDVVVAHSLGSIVAIRALIDAARVGDPAPFAGLVTIGSPGGLKIESLGIDWAPLAAEMRGAMSDEHFRSWPRRWLDLWAPGDRIHTGDFWPLVEATGAKGLSSIGYPCSSSPIDQGTNPLNAHTYFWRSKFVAANLFSLWDSLRPK